MLENCQNLRKDFLFIPTMVQVKIGIIMGSFREGRMNIRVANWVKKETIKRFGKSATIEVKSNWNGKNFNSSNTDNRSGKI